jgi:hypothetical protein
MLYHLRRDFLVNQNNYKLLVAELLRLLWNEANYLILIVIPYFSEGTEAQRLK